MSYSAVVLAREVREGSGGAGELVVEPDAGGQREEFAGDPGSEAVKGSGVVAFEPELVFERPEDASLARSDCAWERAVLSRLHFCTAKRIHGWGEIG